MSLEGVVVDRMREGFVVIDGREYYAIPDVDRMPPFLLSVVSDGDRWMFVSSTGGLTAGRGDAGSALFPYETDDRLHRSAGFTGPVTAIRLQTGELWTPFRGRPPQGASRNLYKTVVGNEVMFEETHPGAGLWFRYRWTSCDEFGFVRAATLANDGGHRVGVVLIDGLLDVLPAGLEPSITQSMGNLAHAYKRSEVVDPDSRLAVYSLESRISDRAEPAEMLRASVGWSAGLEEARLTLSPDSLTGFEGDHAHQAVTKLTGRPGAYLLEAEIELAPGEQRNWYIVADVGRDQAAVARLRHRLVSGGDPEIEASLLDATDSLLQIMAPADALQCTGDRVATAHHFANVTYNILRGGVPRAGYRIDSFDFAQFVSVRNKVIADRHRRLLRSLPARIDRRELLERIGGVADPQLERIAFEYLPFSFSRRHGDPSRPWNRFSIRVHDEAGRPIVHYEGNWRDIFQNWEALCMSFPEFLPSVISVFVGASTADGFNPYRITRDGIDWEVPEPENPWSNIGYWGDHQIVYLLRLLESADRYLPGAIAAMLGTARFSYAAVPYRLAPYARMLEDPRSTISFDRVASDAVADRVERVGGDGKLLWADTDEVHLVTLAEKLLVPALAKLSNFVPCGGIWMNTQRPEWNDANNALVGYGLSMVTLCHLRRYLDHLRALVSTAGIAEVAVSEEVAAWFDAIHSILGESLSDGMVTDRTRKSLLDRLGDAYGAYRETIYATGFSGTTSVGLDRIAALCDVAVEHLDRTIQSARRSDGLYHSYNLIRFSEDGLAAAVEPLQEMLEGQVAVIDSGVLNPEQRADLIDALFASDMYRADAGSFMLYPAHPLPSFLDKNVVPKDEVEANPLLAALVEAEDRSVIVLDAEGRYRFNPDFSIRNDLAAALGNLSDEWRELVASHADAALDTYERVFRHHEYTGRSGSMYGYEGIGSIYWHMVAKLLVAVQESVLDGRAGGASDRTLQRLIDHYWRIRTGLGFNKSAVDFGAFPLDPHSHSPAHAGAQQPGMTGLVKEELLVRPLEVGIRVDAGIVSFDPILVRQEELVPVQEPWRTLDLELQSVDLVLPPASLGATICQVPVTLTAAPTPEVEVVFVDGSTQRFPGLAMDRETSSKVFGRTGEISRVQVWIPLPGR